MCVRVYILLSRYAARTCNVIPHLIEEAAVIHRTMMAARHRRRCFLHAPVDIGGSPILRSSLWSRRFLRWEKITFDTKVLPPVTEQLFGISVSFSSERFRCRWEEILQANTELTLHHREGTFPEAVLHGWPLYTFNLDCRHIKSVKQPFFYARRVQIHPTVTLRYLL